jgi:hypothetical protein
MKNKGPAPFCLNSSALSFCKARAPRSLCALFRTQRVLSLVVVLGVSANSVSAQITPSSVRFWRLGEDDSGAANGGAGNATTQDHTSAAMHLSQDANAGGQVTYSNNTPSGPVFHTSTLSMAFVGSGNSAGYIEDSVASTAVDNFLLEAWVNPANTTTFNQAIAYNGTTLNGYGIFQQGTYFTANIVGSNLIQAQVAVANTWTHLALVRNNGTATFFINGSSVGSTGTAPTTPTLAFTIGESFIGDPFSGRIDEVRFAEFSAGSFSTSMLNISAIPEPSTYAAMAGAAMLGLAVWRRRRASSRAAVSS